MIRKQKKEKFLKGLLAIQDQLILNQMLQKQRLKKKFKEYAKNKEQINKDK